MARAGEGGSWSWGGGGAAFLWYFPLRSSKDKSGWSLISDICEPVWLRESTRYLASEKVGHVWSSKIEEELSKVDNSDTMYCGAESLDVHSGLPLNEAPERSPVKVLPNEVSTWPPGTLPRIKESTRMGGALGVSGEEEAVGKIIGIGHS